VSSWSKLFNGDPHLLLPSGEDPTPRPEDFQLSPGPNVDQLSVGPERPPFPNGQSAFGDIGVAITIGLTGPYFRLPGGIPLPLPLRVIADGKDVRQDSTRPETHHTIYPADAISFGSLVQLVAGLPWEYVGRVR
jgi:hypothetical protein